MRHTPALRTAALAILATLVVATLVLLLIILNTDTATAAPLYRKQFILGTGQMALNHCWITLDGEVGTHTRDWAGRWGFWCWVPVR
jgi:hypothetical protein